MMPIMSPMFGANGNPLMQLMQMARQGGNPMQMLSQISQRNPQMQQVMGSIQGKNPQQLKTMAQNLARERGINLDSFAQQMGMKLPK